ncbi:MAG: regulatory protein RecX [Planctomycetes bacterium]|nr:regulatory protein RecX [Planctomycetota bacterium]
MTTITAISPVAGKPHLISVRVAGRVVARVRATDVRTLGLSVGQPWTERLDASVRDAATRQRVRGEALGLLARRARSRGELAERLAARGHETDTVDGILDEMESSGLLDDHAYARACVEDLLGRGPAGRALVVERLTRRRLAPALAERVADEVLSARREADDAVAWARRRLRAMHGVPPEIAARRIATGLARRGVDEDAIRGALADLDLPSEHPPV